MAGNFNTGNLGGDLRGLMPSPEVYALHDLPGTRKIIKKFEEGKYLKVEGKYIVPGDPGGGGGPDREQYPGPMTPIGEDFAGDSGKDADGNHSHPGEEVAGGTRYFVGAIAGTTSSYYASSEAAYDAMSLLKTEPTAAWEVRGLCASQGGYMGPY